MSFKNLKIRERLDVTGFLFEAGWLEMVSETYSDSRFKETFRVKRETFFYILEKIEGSISKD